VYNRYIRNETGRHTRVPQEDPPHRQPSAPQPQNKESRVPPPTQKPSYTAAEEPPRSRSSSDGLSSILRHLLDQLRLDRVDTGDLLLLGLLFFLFREKADEELLVALGLLLIL